MFFSNSLERSKWLRFNWPDKWRREQQRDARKNRMAACKAETFAKQQRVEADRARWLNEWWESLPVWERCRSCYVKRGGDGVYRQVKR